MHISTPTLRAAGWNIVFWGELYRGGRWPRDFFINYVSNGASGLISVKQPFQTTRSVSAGKGPHHSLHSHDLRADEPDREKPFEPPGVCCTGEIDQGRFCSTCFPLHL